MTAIILDLETLDTKPSACVVSVAAVAVGSNGIEGSFYSETDTNDQMMRGRTIGPKTMEWWNKQPMNVQAALVGVKPPPQLVLDGLTQFFERFGEPLTVWGYGSDFDNTILASLFHTYNIPQPWSYRNSRCLRTFVAVAKEIDGNAAWPVFEGNAHHALDDAMNQARMFICARTILGIG